MSETIEKFRINTLTVPIENVHPNPWNPKDSVDDNKKNAERFETIKKGIVEHGFLMAVTVREIVGREGHYEIIDGFHRWKACTELGYSVIQINNLGIVDDSRAKALTLVFERAKVEPNAMKEAELISTIYSVIGDYDEMAKILPYDAKVLQDKVELLAFDWGQFGKTEELEPGEKEQKETLKFIFQLETADDFELCNSALALAGEDKSEAFLEIARYYYEQFKGKEVSQ